MNKEYWKFCLGRVLAVPIDNLLCWRLSSSQKALRPEEKEGEKSRQGCSVEVESVAQECHVCQEVNEADTL